MEPQAQRSRTPPGAPVKGNRPGLALLAFALAFMLVSVGFEAAFEAWQTRIGSGRQRNPHFRRAWVEHVRDATPARRGEFLVVLIGNSQAYGREVEEVQSYPAQLQLALTQELRAPARVVNWAIPGGDGPEFVLLAAAAQRLRPDVLLLSATPANFDRSNIAVRRWPERRQAWASDAQYLLGDPGVRRFVPRAYLDRCFEPIDEVDVRLGSWWRLWRHRTLPAAALLRWGPLRAAEAWFAPESWFVRPAPLPPIAKRSAQGTVSPELVGWYLEAARGAAPRSVFALMPLHSAWRDHHGEWCRECRAVLVRSGAVFWDLSGALPDRHFLTATHLDAAGHARLAKLLAARLAP